MKGTKNETHVIEFSVNLPKDSIKKLCQNSGLVVDPKYSSCNRGVTFGLKITGPRNVLEKLVRKCGYPGQNPGLEKPRTNLDRILNDILG